MDVEQRLKIIMTPAITSLIDSRCSNNCNEVLRETTQRLEDWQSKNRSHRDEFNNIASLLKSELNEKLESSLEIIKRKHERLEEKQNLKADLSLKLSNIENEWRDQ